MTVIEYRNILELAIDRIAEYTKGQNLVTHKEFDKDRKEAHLAYWIAVVAKEEGIKLGRQELQ